MVHADSKTSIEHVFQVDLLQFCFGHDIGVDTANLDRPPPRVACHIRRSVRAKESHGWEQEVASKVGFRHRSGPGRGWGRANQKPTKNCLFEQVTQLISLLRFFEPRPRPPSGQTQNAKQIKKVLLKTTQSLNKLHNRARSVNPRYGLINGEGARDALKAY